MSPTPRPLDPTTAAPLRLDTTGQLLGGPLVGPHDNRTTSRHALAGCVAMLERVGAN